MEITGDDVIPMGKEILKNGAPLQRGAGFTAEDDRLPEFMRFEKLPPHNVVWDTSDEELDQVYAWVNGDSK